MTPGRGRRSLDVPPSPPAPRAARPARLTRAFDRAALAVAIALVAVALSTLAPAVGRPIPMAPAAVSAADPSPTPAPGGHAPGCREQYPEAGPAGVDLFLGCLARRIVDAYTGRADTDTPVAALTYLPVIAGFAVAAVGLILLARWAWRRADRRMAPVMPVAWWACPACHSVNGAGAEQCYACGADAPTDAIVMPTAEHPEMPQAFGGTRKTRRWEDGPE